MNNIDRILNNDLTKCHYPFFWLYGEETVENVVAAVNRAADMGCDGITVEPRGFQDFEKRWWELFDAIVETCVERNIKIIVLDEDYHGPTGHAFGALLKPENAHLRRKSVYEAHVDVIGPANIDLVVGRTAMWTPTKVQDDLIGCYLYKRTDDKNGIDISGGVDLMPNINKGILSCEIPEGNYRVVYVYAGSKYSEINKDDFIDMCDAESVDLLIKTVYDLYEERYGKYFGSTIIGFFSDEPFLGNAYVYCSTGRGIHEDTRIGRVGQTVPINQNIIDRVKAVYGDDFIKYIPSIWYWDEEISPNFRNVYMNVIADLYSECFTQKLGAWCKDRGLLYTGHVLEDNNLHTRLGDGPAHYFRSQFGQTLAGMDIVLHQIMPGFADVNLGGYGAYLYENEFYHYILGKLASSAAHTYPEYNGKSMCEVTIGYGWAEGSQLAKWLFDYLLVRGTNFFVPGAIASTFVDNIHAPHFGEKDGREPQQEGFAKILDYSKKVVTAFDGTTHICNALLLYNAQAEWMNKDEYMLMQSPAKRLYDAHIDFDILSEDLLDNIKVVDGKCTLIETYDVIVVPYAKYLPKFLIEKLTSLIDQGADVVFVNAQPENTEKTLTVVDESALAQYCIDKNYVDITVDGFKFLRHYHAEKDGVHTYMFFNEHATNTFDGEICTKQDGDYNVYDFITGKHYHGVGNKIKLRLEPYQSCIVVYEQDRGYLSYVNYDKLSKQVLTPDFKVQAYDYMNMNEISAEQQMTDIIPYSKVNPEFSGKLVYTAKVQLKKTDVAFIKIDGVGENAKLYLNGKFCGHAICKPFAFDVSDAVLEGENDLRIEVYTTIANAVKDPVSMFVPLSPTGIYGEIKYLYK